MDDIEPVHVDNVQKVKDEAKALGESMNYDAQKHIVEIALCEATRPLLAAFFVLDCKNYIRGTVITDDGQEYLITFTKKTEADEHKSNNAQ